MCSTKNSCLFNYCITCFFHAEQNDYWFRARKPHIFFLKYGFPLPVLNKNENIINNLSGNFQKAQISSKQEKTICPNRKN